MDPLTVAETYGQALFDAAACSGNVDAVHEELLAVQGVFAEHPGLKRLFTVPTLSEDQKKDAAAKVFKGRLSSETYNFLCILIDKRRVGAWDAIAHRYASLVDARDGFTKGVLYSVVPVEGERLSRLEAEAGKAIGKAVRLENRIDKALLGGVSIFVDGKFVDMSVKGRLERLKQRMMG